MKYHLRKKQSLFSLFKREIFIIFTIILFIITAKLIFDVEVGKILISPYVIEISLWSIIGIILLGYGIDYSVYLYRHLYVPITSEELKDNGINHWHDYNVFLYHFFKKREPLNRVKNSIEKAFEEQFHISKYELYYKTWHEFPLFYNSFDDSADIMINTIALAFYIILRILGKSYLCASLLCLLISCMMHIIIVFNDFNERKQKNCYDIKTMSQEDIGNLGKKNDYYEKVIATIPSITTQKVKK